MTILAEPPKDAEHREPDRTLEAVRNRLEPHVSDSYSIEGASTVAGLGNVLKRDLLKNEAPPELVQIIGHGRPGMLFLGATWTMTFGDKLRSFVLQCNLREYGLLRELVMPGTTVVLLGCRIGLVTTGRSLEIADGPALLFALHRLWGVEVSAPNHMVIPDDFVNGIYRYPDYLVRAHDMRVDHAASDLHGRRAFGVAARGMSPALR